MGVEYRHTLIPKKMTYWPKAERVSRFAAALTREGWVFAPGTPAFKKLVNEGNFDEGCMYEDAAKTGASFETIGRKAGSAPLPLSASWLRSHRTGVTVSWPIERAFELGARYPLTSTPYIREWVYFAIEIEWSRLLLGVAGENFSSPSRIVCTCGADFRSEAHFAFHPLCPGCDQPIEASSRTPLGRSGLHRFAISIECGKSVPEHLDDVSFDSAFVELVRRHFNVDFFELGNVH
jgi:hypothetical protein